MALKYAGLVDLFFFISNFCYDLVRVRAAKYNKHSSHFNTLLNMIYDIKKTIFFSPFPDSVHLTFPSRTACRDSTLARAPSSSASERSGKHCYHEYFVSVSDKCMMACDLVCEICIAARLPVRRAHGKL